MLDYNLPSDIVAVTVERGGTRAAPELDIEVRRRAPAVAYAIVAVAVLCASMYDISMQLLVRLCSSTLCLCCAIARCFFHVSPASETQI
jgi:hypothetical protein